MACTSILGDFETVEDRDSGSYPDAKGDARIDPQDASDAETSTGDASDAGDARHDADAAPDVNNTGCANPALAESFPNKMYGCPGHVYWQDRNTLCRGACTACPASRWSATNGVVIPKHHYWTEDDLVWSGDMSNHCGVVPASSSSFSCVSTDPDAGVDLPSPMRVCTPGDGGFAVPDPEGNTCTWVNCGYLADTPDAANTYFGGCSGTDYSAGTLCCCP